MNCPVQPGTHLAKGQGEGRDTDPVGSEGRYSPSISVCHSSHRWSLRIPHFFPDRESCTTRPFTSGPDRQIDSAVRTHTSRSGPPTSLWNTGGQDEHTMVFESAGTSAVRLATAPLPAAPPPPAQRDSPLPPRVASHRRTRLWPLPTIHGLTLIPPEFRWTTKSANLRAPHSPDGHQHSGPRGNPEP